ncbi:MAG: hypothetical protein QM500_08620 [Methylococcales bacterium]
MRLNASSEIWKESRIGGLASAGKKMIIANEFHRSKAIELIKSWSLKSPMELVGQIYTPDRSKAQNRLSFKWYSELAKQSGNGIDHERNTLKFKYGCEVLMKNDKNEAFRGFYNKLIETYIYEDCVSSMAFISVTSLMNVSEFTEYLRHIETYALGLGFHLSKPDEYKNAMGK